MLYLTEGEAGLWERYQNGDRGAAVPVVPRWNRAADLGVRTEGAAHPIGVRGTELATLRDAAFGVIAEGARVVDALEAEVASRGLLAVIADANGVIVRARGGAAFAQEVKKTRLVEGVRWDEGTRGTNAIGTALAEKRAVAVVGRAHWEKVNHGLFCYAAPVVDPFGSLVAVVDVTGPIENDSAAIGAAVRSAAAAMSEVLRSRAYARSDAGSFALVRRLIERCATPVVLVEAPGVVSARNDAASAEFDLPEGAITVERLFGASYDDLVRVVADGVSFETKRRRFRASFEPVIADGRVLAMVCMFSPIAAPTRPPLAIETAAPPAFDRVFAKDAGVAAAKRMAAQLARSEVPVLLLAETGTGKELFAQAIHRASPRASGPFVAVNCGALSGALLESELFGYAPGAFTGARTQGAEGKVAAANRGTLFLDEVAEMSPAAQAMLLRFLEDGSYSRIGEATQRRSDVRIVCATCRDLPHLVKSGAFRQDLFFRIHGGCVRLPPLRARTDRVELARVLLDQISRASGEPRPALGSSAEAWILDHDWPGNVRELKTALAYAVAVVGGGSIEREHFPEPLLASAPERDETPSKKHAMRALADDALRRAGGNLSEAARALGVARSTLYRLRTPDRR